MKNLALPSFLCSLLMIGAVLSNADAKTSPNVDSACVVRAAGESQSITYPVQLQIMGDDAKGLGSGVVTISHPDGSGPISIDCAKPEVIVRLLPGDYIATVDAAGGPATNLKFRVLPSEVPKILALRLPQSRPYLTIR